MNVYSIIDKRYGYRFDSEVNAIELGGNKTINIEHDNWYCLQSGEEEEECSNDMNFKGLEQAVSHDEFISGLFYPKRIRIIQMN